MSNLQLTVEQVVAAPPHDLVLRCTLENDPGRSVQILSYELEIWLVEDRRTATAVFLSRLVPDFTTGFPSELNPGQRRTLSLRWHSSPAQVQRIEHIRRGGDVTLQIFGHFNLLSSWAPGEPKTAAWERPVSRDGQFPINLPLPQSVWAGLLNRLGFRHGLLAEVALPGAIRRTTAHLEKGWELHRSGLSRDALMQCGQALETLGLDLFDADNLSRRVMIDRLVPQADARKKEHLFALWGSLHDFLQLGRPELDRTVPLYPRDSELALLCATALVSYLARFSE